MVKLWGFKVDQGSFSTWCWQMDKDQTAVFLGFPHRSSADLKVGCAIISVLNLRKSGWCYTLDIFLLLSRVNGEIFKDKLQISTFKKEGKFHFEVK